MNAVDTNVYLYTLDADECAKQAKAIELLDQLWLKPADTMVIDKADRAKPILRCQTARQWQIALDSQRLRRYCPRPSRWVVDGLCGTRVRHAQSFFAP